MTSQSHFFDTFFKFSLANSKHISGTKFFISQHGGSYFYNNLDIHLFWEKRISDIFFSWGNYDIDNKVKFLGTNRIKDFSNNPIYILVVIDGISRNYSSYATPDPDHMLDYLDEVSDLIKKLEKRYKVIVRTYQNNNFDKQYLYNKNKNIIFDKNKDPYKSYKGSKLVISCAFATSALETMSNNVPTTIFIPKKMNFYNLNKLASLVENNIFFEDKFTLINFLLDNDFNIHNWWFSEQVQAAINDFNINYCNKNSNLVHELKKYI